MAFQIFRKIDVSVGRSNPIKMQCRYVNEYKSQYSGCVFFGKEHLYEVKQYKLNKIVINRITPGYPEKIVYEIDGVLEFSNKSYSRLCLVLKSNRIIVLEIDTFEIVYDVVEDRLGNQKKFHFFHNYYIIHNSHGWKGKVYFFLRDFEKGIVKERQLKVVNDGYAKFVPDYWYTIDLTTYFIHKDFKLVSRVENSTLSVNSNHAMLLCEKNLTIYNRKDDSETTYGVVEAVFDCYSGYGVFSRSNDDLYFSIVGSDVSRLIKGIAQPWYIVDASLDRSYLLSKHGKIYTLYSFLPIMSVNEKTIRKLYQAIPHFIVRDERGNSFKRNLTFLSNMSSLVESHVEEGREELIIPETMNLFEIERALDDYLVGKVENEKIVEFFDLHSI